MTKLSLKCVAVCMIGCYISVADTVDACDVVGILTCNQMLGTSTTSLSQGVLPNAGVLMKTCSLIDHYMTCVDEKITGCDSQTKMVVQVVKDVVDFMCRDSYQAILDNGDCWINPDFKSDINQCMVTYNETAKRINGRISIMGATEMYRQLCEAMHDVTNCMSSAGKTRCGTEPALIMLNMMNAAFRETYKLIRGCSAPTVYRIVTTSATNDLRTTAQTSNASTTMFSYALYVAAIISCVVVLTA